MTKNFLSGDFFSEKKNSRKQFWEILKLRSASLNIKEKKNSDERGRNPSNVL